MRLVGKLTNVPMMLSLDVDITPYSKHFAIKLVQFSCSYHKVGVLGPLDKETNSSNGIIIYRPN